MNKININVDYELYAGIDELPEADQALCKEAIAAMSSSHSPYSGFRVGTAVRLLTGEVILGSNQENVAYPSGLCAERVALFQIGASHKGKGIDTMAITAHTTNFRIEKPVTSCGACLQVMAEYEKLQEEPISVLFYCIDGEILKVTGMRSLMPFAFVEERLKS